MARLLLNAFPSLPQHTQRVELGGVRFRIRLTWRSRLSSWYLDLEREDGTPVVSGRRLSPRWGPLFGIRIDDAPGGVLYVRGPDPYAREDLGGALQLVFSPTADLPDPTPAPDAPTVTLLVGGP